MTLKRIAVTGGSGKAGRATLRDLADYGYDVLNIDLAPPAEPIAPFLRCDLCDYGQAVDALAGCDAVVHHAAIPAPGLWPEEHTFRINATSTYNVFAAARRLDLVRVVWASSETTLGLAFGPDSPPAFAPVDESHPLWANSSYALSKTVGEEMARQFARWTGKPIIGLRFSNIMEPHDYERFESFQADPMLRIWNLWGYVDARDVAQACRRALEAEVAGAESMIIAAADTVMRTPSAELMRAHFPQVELRDLPGPHATLLSIDKARRLIGYTPEHSWRPRA